MSSETLYLIEQQNGDWQKIDTFGGVVSDIIDGQVEKPLRIFQAIVDENFIRDITEDTASHIFKTRSHEPFSNHVADFLEKHLPDAISVQLRRAA